MDRSLFNSLSFHFHLIVAGELAFPDVLEFGVGELAAKAFQVVSKDYAIEVVELMLHDAGQIARHPFIVLLELLVLVGDANTGGALHFFVNAWQTEAALLHNVLFRLVVFLDVGIDEGPDVTFVLGKVVADDIEIDDDEPDGQTYLRRCQADALAAFEGFVHIPDELLQLWIVLVYFLSLLTEHGLTECVYW